MAAVRLQVVFHGRVQGVGFRATCLDVASRLPVSGYVRNQSDGTVLLVAEGERADLETLVRLAQAETMGEVIRTEQAESAATGEFTGRFRVRH